MLAVCFQFYLMTFPHLYGPNVKMIMNDKLGRMLKESLWPTLSHSPESARR
jgi:hypothetical protein